ncbi:uncharacterized protein [Miscanthus floridulus]|uniref:uncharacterized protein n=1 Tax=Miscanthus floridulus TaxID=154761 RepID=UPI0034599B03
MVTYYREVCQLEDKFDGLELSHILRRLNEVANALVKIASGREPVPMGIFASDQYKPLVCYEELEQIDDGLPALGLGANLPVAPSDPKVIELDEDPATEPDPLADERMLYLDYHLREVLPMDKIEAQRLVGAPSPLSLLRASSTGEATPGSYSVASPSNKGSSC